MTAPGLSPGEQRIVERFEVAEPAPESWQGNRYCLCAANGARHLWSDHFSVTARPVGDGDGQDGLREALAQAAYVPRHGHVMNRLLPLVERIARERAAEVLAPFLAAGDRTDNGPRPGCALHPLGMPACDRPAVYEMDIDRDEKWIPLCVEHGTRHRRSSNVRVRTLRGQGSGDGHST